MNNGEYRPVIPHESDSRVPDASELAHLFAPLSPNRERLRRSYRLLQRYEPAPPPYVYWHLARFVHALGTLADVVRPGQRWLDISSDPWFCLLAKKEIAASTELVATGYRQTKIDFRNKSGQVDYTFAAHPLELRDGETYFALGRDFDLVSSFEVIEHLQFHPAPFLAGCNSALRPGGRMLLTTPNVASWSSINRLLDGATPHMTGQYGGPMEHRKEYTAWELRRLVETAGFRVDKLVTFDGYPNDRQDLRTRALWFGTVLWHAASLQAGRTRNLIVRSGSTLMVLATKVAPCNVTRVAAVKV
ncbi:class I SAM-dependent methyltransferase [Sorangium sp. So ce302]|uniref:class I SAM-dependent methyltransferase n=1 Tax=Sorangium sp. So ce302 TaxID=3133297 RepID=UPI003F60CE4C